MRQSSQNDVEKKFSCHVPDQWKSKVRRKKRSVLEITDVEKKKEEDGITKEDLESDFGINSGKLDFFSFEKAHTIFAGTWSYCGSTSKIPESSSSVSTKNEMSLPNIRVPGALEIDPMVRKIAKGKEMSVSEGALWLLIYSAREYTTSILKHTIEKCKSINESSSDNHITNPSYKITPLDLARSLECNDNPKRINQTVASSRLGWERCIQSLDRVTPQSELASLEKSKSFNKFYINNMLQKNKMLQLLKNNILYCCKMKRRC